MCAMTTLDYIINAVLVLLVLRQIHGHKLDLRSLVLPLALVALAAHNYLHTIPTAGNDLVLIAILALSGTALGTLAALFTRISADAEGVPFARAGWVAAALWIGGIGARMGFAFAADHGAGHAIAQFSAANHITGSAAWTAALVLMALCEVTARVVALQVRAWQTTRTVRRLAAVA
jgi:hypothetical protein